MILYHKDSAGQDHYLRFRTTNPDRLQRIGRKLSRRASRVIFARTPADRARLLAKEMATIARYEAYCGVTVDEWNATPSKERFLL